MQKRSVIFKIKGQLTPDSSLQQPSPRTLPKLIQLLTAKEKHHHWMRRKWPQVALDLIQEKTLY